MTRNQFLTKTWKRYPVVPAKASFLGRVQEISRSPQGVSVQLERGGVSRSQNFQTLFFNEISDASAEAVFAVLAPGDLVAVEPSGAVTLLAPQRRTLPPRRFHREHLHLWQEYLQALGDFFRRQGFLELATPTLVPCPGTEPSLDPFITEFVQGSRREKFYLPTSPELHLKKALALGAEKIFEIRRCFRNSEVTEHHQPEFTMIEWYRAYGDLNAIQQDVRALIGYLVQTLPGLKAPAASETFSVAALFEKHCQFAFTPETSSADLKGLAEKLKIDVSSATSVDDFFFRIFFEKIEKNFPPERMVFVENYPPFQAALARISAEGWGERFEMYWQGLEIANAFHELNDPEVQRIRFSEDLAKKKQRGKESVNLDPEFMQCLEAGMPPASGIALGVERLFMALTGIREISQTRLFPLS
jgi:lysyl-tRNA synthetase class 2